MMLEVLVDEHWVLGRYEWSFSLERLPYLLLVDEQESTIAIGPNTPLRWPLSSDR